MLGQTFTGTFHTYVRTAWLVSSAVDGCRGMKALTLVAVFRTRTGEI